MTDDTPRDWANEKTETIFKEVYEQTGYDLPLMVGIAFAGRFIAALRTARDEGVAEGMKRAAKVADAKAAECRVKRVVPGDLERNYFGGGMEAAVFIAAAIRQGNPKQEPQT